MPMRPRGKRMTATITLINFKTAESSQLQEGIPSKKSLSNQKKSTLKQTASLFVVSGNSVGNDLE